MKFLLMFKIFKLVTIIILFSSCYNVRLTKSNGQRYWLYSLRNDGYRWNRTFVSSRTSEFSIDSINVKTDTFYHKRKYEYINVNNIKDIASRNNVTAIVLWYTDCPTTTYQAIKIAKAIKEHQLEALLISLEYEFERMDINLYNAKYFYNSYLLPQEPYGKHIITKHISLVKNLDDNYYKTHKDDVIDYQCLLIDNKGRILKSFHFDSSKEEIVNEMAILNNTQIDK